MKKIIPVFGLFALIPLFDKNTYHLDVLTNVGIYALLAMGLNVVVGLTGLLNLGYAAFFAIGAYTYALMNIHWHVPFWAGLPAAGVVSMLFGFLIGLPSIRVRGDYLAITTLGFGEITRIAFNNLDAWTGGPNGLLGIERPSFFGYTFSVNPTPYFYLMIVLLSLTAFLLFRLTDSKIGRALVAIREDHRQEDHDPHDADRCHHRDPPGRASCAHPTRAVVLSSESDQEPARCGCCNQPQGLHQLRRETVDPGCRRSRQPDDEQHIESIRHCVSQVSQCRTTAQSDDVARRAK